MMITKITKYGKGYETPSGLTEDKYYELMYEFIDLAKVKRTYRKASPKTFY